MEIFKLFGSILIKSDEAEKSIQKTESKAMKLAGALGNGIKTAAKVGAAAVGAAAAGVTALLKQSIDGFSEYEQLVGGIETLFEDLSWDVQQNAANAYKTAGLSASEYMATVTSFAASLNQSLQASDGNIARSAELADQAITDMADNANKMGSSMESIQNAYQGFAKQNYTMLDNLKLGYGGTKEEMQRLLEDAEKLSGQKFDLSSYADIVDAIHIVQTEMGITGTTAKEASETISGSMASAKAAWGNLVTGIADDNADISTLITAFADSVITVGDNLIPRIEKTLEGVGEMVNVFAEKLLPKVIEVIMAHLPDIIETGALIVTKLIVGLAKALPQLIDQVPELIRVIVEGIIDCLPDLLDAGKQLMYSLWDGIKSVWEGIANWVSEKVSWLTDKLTFWDNGTSKMSRDGGFSHASGLAYVPYDNYPAILHRGESVLNANDTNKLLDGFRMAMADSVNAMGALNGGNCRVEIPVSVGGRELCRAILPDLRAVMRSDPEVI